MVGSVERIGPASAKVRRTTSWTLLVQIQEAHNQLLCEMANLTAITYSPAPLDDGFMQARWQISQATLRRRLVAVRIYDFLLPRLDGPDIGRLNSVNSADRQLLRQSARHVGTWTAEKCRGDWRTYSTACREMLTHMKCHTLLEKQTLYPMLQSTARRWM